MDAAKPRITVEYADSATVLAFADERILEESDIQELSRAVLGVVDQAERMNLILDFGRVRFLSSAVLGLLIRVNKRICERGGRLRLCGIHPDIYDVFRITRLTEVFDIRDDRQGALRDLAATA